MVARSTLKRLPVRSSKRYTFGNEPETGDARSLAFLTSLSIGSQMCEGPHRRGPKPRDPSARAHAGIGSESTTFWPDNSLKGLQACPAPSKLSRGDRDPCACCVLSTLLISSFGTVPLRMGVLIPLQSSSSLVQDSIPLTPDRRNPECQPPPAC